MTSTSASVAICDSSGCSVPADALPKCRSPVAAIRMHLAQQHACPMASVLPLTSSVTSTTVQAPSRHASEFYKRVITALSGPPTSTFLVGGAFAFVRYTGIGRDTKDLDLFIRRADWDQASRRPRRRWASPTELTFPHWLGKAYGGRQREFFVDLIFSGGNGVAEVDDEWFAHAMPDESLGFPGQADAGRRNDLVEGVPDGTRAVRWRGCAAPGPRAPEATSTGRDSLSRFGEHWRVLLSHLVLFPYVYPNEPAPQDVIDELLDRAKSEPKADEGIRLVPGTAALARAISCGCRAVELRRRARRCRSAR